MAFVMFMIKRVKNYFYVLQSILKSLQKVFNGLLAESIFSETFRNLSVFYYNFLLVFLFCTSRSWIVVAEENVGSECKGK